MRSLANEREEDIEAKLIFIRLQPVIHPLLQAIQDYRALVASSSNYDFKKILASLRIQSELLQRLHTDIFPKLASEHELSNTKLSKIVCLLLDYILFPILAILKGTVIGWNGEERVVDQLAVKSASFLVVQDAAWLLCVLLDILQFPPEEKFIRCLIACAFALPTSQYLMNDYRHDTSLDRGDNCLKHTFDAIRRLVRHSGFTNNQAFADSLANALDGALLARLADCIVALVEPSESGKPVHVDLQLQALLTLQTIMTTVPMTSIWRHMFPGIFAGVYRCCLQAIRIAQQSPKLAATSLAVISDLLRICIQSDTASVKDVTNESREKIVTEKLKSLALLKETDTLAEARQSRTGPVHSNKDEFVTRANTLLPTPLTILFNMTTAAQAPHIRENLVGLLSVVLVQEPSFWESGATIVTTAFESCLILSQDSQQDIASTASAVLIEYRNKMGSDYLASIPRKVGPRIMSIVDGLTAIWEAARETDMVSSLRLMNGYLKAMALSKDTKRKLKACIMMEDNLSVIRDVFSSLCSPSVRRRDVGESEPLSLESLVLNNEKRAKITTLGQQNGELQNTMESTICSLSLLLGVKATVYAIDQSVTDLFADIEARLAAGFSQSGLSQAVWADSWAVLLKGLATSNWTSRRKDVFRQLTNSTLPLVFSESVWGLPIEDDLVTSIGSGATSTLTRKQDLVPTATSANANLIVALLGLVESITDFFVATAVDGQLAIMLLPLLDKANSGVPTVSDKAQRVLRKIAKLNTGSEIDSLILQQVESIFGAILLKIRIPGGRPAQKVNAVNSDILAAARVTSFAIQSITESFKEASQCENPDERFDARAIMSPEEVIRELVSRFDLAGSDVHSNTRLTGLFLTLFQNISNLLFAFYGCHIEENKGKQRPQYPEPWFDLLESYKMTSLSPDEGFAEHFQNEQTKKDSFDTYKVSRLSTSHLQRDTDFMALLIARSAYTLSHPSLAIQIKSCETLISAFYFLALIASIPLHPGEEETNGPRSAILRQIHSAWPSVSSRLKAISAEVTPSNKTSLVVKLSTTQPAQTDISEKRVYLAKLFDLIAGMAEASDDFMARRFRDVVWPCIGGLMACFLKRTHAYTESEIDLLCSIIRCCGRIYKHRDTGEALSGLIPSIGGVLIPFLGDENQLLSDLCTDTFQAMLSVDSDALRRPLFERAGCVFKPCPFFDQSSDVAPGAGPLRSHSIDRRAASAREAAKV